MPSDPLNQPVVSNPDVVGLKDYEVRYDRYPTRRAGLPGLWGRRMEFWTEDGKQMGAWQWVEWTDRMWWRGGS